MIVNINQNSSTFDETLHALKYSAVAKQVQFHETHDIEKENSQVYWKAKVVPKGGWMA